LKVLFVITGNPFSYYKGSISPQVLGPANALIENGVKVDYFQVKSKGVKGYLKSLRLLQTYLKEKKYDIIHAHYGNCGIISAIAKKKEKLIVSYMGSDLLGSINSKGEFIFIGWFFVFLNKIFSTFINDYSIVKAQIMKKSLWKKSNVSVVPNGVDFKNFYPMGIKEARTILEISSKIKLILFVGDITTALKNFQLAKHAVEIINDKLISLKIISGINHSKLNLYYNAADLILMTSTQEGSPNVIKEAMACNCPIISTDVGDVKEIISNTEGCYISSFEQVDIAEKIKLVLLNNKRTNGRNNINNLGSNIIANRTIRIYDTLLR